MGGGEWHAMPLALACPTADMVADGARRPHESLAVA